MKKIMLSILLCLSLIGCATTPPADIKPSVVVEYRYVSAPIPDENLVIPDKIPDIDLATATQKDVALWLVKKEERTDFVINELKNIKENQDKNKAKETK